MKKSLVIAQKLFIENNGILRASKAKKLGIHPNTLREMVDIGLLVKEAKGIYRIASLPPLSNPDLVQVSLRVPHSVICLISALSFHQMTTQMPYKIYISIPQNTKRPHIDYPPIEVIKQSGKAYSTGIIEYELEGVLVRIYNKEKTVADCFKFRNKIGQDIAIEALKNYLHENRRDIEKLLYFAKIDRVEKVITPYIEAVI
jgi:predicted transcriptional regulator of viral defense system